MERVDGAFDRGDPMITKRRRAKSGNRSGEGVDEGFCILHRAQENCFGAKGCFWDCYLVKQAKNVHNSRVVVVLYYVHCVL